MEMRRLMTSYSRPNIIHEVYKTSHAGPDLRQRILKLAKLIVVQVTQDYKIITFPWQITLFQSLPTLFKYLSEFHRTLTQATYLYARWIMQMGHSFQISK